MCAREAQKNEYLNPHGREETGKLSEKRQSPACDLKENQGFACRSPEKDRKPLPDYPWKH